MARYTGNNNNSDGKYEREGVVYEPSSARQKNNYKQQTEEHGGYENDYEDYGRSSKRQVQRQKTAKQKSQFALFYILTLATGVIICIVVFAIVFTNISKKRSEAEANSLPVATSTPEPTEPSGLVSELKQTIGIIKDISPSQLEMKVIELETDKEYSLVLDGATSIKNKFGQEIVLAELLAGDVVNISFNTKNSLLKSINIDSTAWEVKLTKGVKVDSTANVITIGNDRYIYNDDIIIINQNSKIDISEITDVDLVTVRGYKNRAWFIEVHKSHGFVEIINGERINDGNLEVDTTIFLSLAEADKVELQEGPHQIVVTGSNIEPFIKDVVIKQGQTEILDLSKILFKTSVVTVKSNISEYRLFINEKEYLTSEPIVLDLGTYTFEARKAGYLTFTQTVEITEPIMSIDINLQQEVVVRKFQLTTVPEGAEVYIDNGYVGTSPVTDNLTDGKHTITVRKTGYNDTSISVDINEQARLSYSITMQPLYTDLPVANTPAPEEFQEDSQEYSGEDTLYETPVNQ